MATLEGNLEILKAQAEWVQDYSDSHPEESAIVVQQQIDNIELMVYAVKNDTINPTLTPPPPTP